MQVGDDMNYDNNELYHYGVRGMKWGVRRATKTLSSSKSTSEQREKAVSSLQKHRAKASAKVAKLEKKHPQLEKDVDRYITKTDVKAKSMQREATRTRAKAYGRFTTRKRAERLIYKADKMQARADELKARSESVKAKLKSNERMQELFKKGISDIDSALVSAGREYLKD